MTQKRVTPLYILTMQVASISLIWFFTAGITIWITNLIITSIALNDAPNASVAISIVVIPIFFSLASVLTYVFIGLRRHRSRPGATDSGGEK
ncbi:MAG: hypothetical protein V3W14_01535 [Candidatus Neomarinimicrobiota bacterium]